MVEKVKMANEHIKEELLNKSNKNNKIEEFFRKEHERKKQEIISNSDVNIIVKYIENKIKELENNIDTNTICLSLFNGTLMELKNIKFKYPCIIEFSGYIDDNPCVIIQHISQCNVNFISIHKNKEPTEKRKPIGFHHI